VGSEVIFQCEGGQFVRDLECLMKSQGAATAEELMAQVEAFLAAGPDEETIREQYGACIEDAIFLALKAFYGKKSIDGEPAVLHALTVGAAGKTKEEKILGYIHDVVEDTDTTFDDLLRMGYTRKVVEAARLCTRDRETPYFDYVQAIIDSGNETAINVKINDLNHNLSRGARTEQEAERDGNEAILERIRRINQKHQKAIELINNR